MASDREKFFQLRSFAVVGHTELRSFPKLSYTNLRKMGKTAFAVDLSGAARVNGDPAYPSLTDLPEPVEGAILEVPRDQTLGAVQQASEAGIKDVWIHMGTETPEALEFCRENGIRVRHGTCAVMYTQRGLSYHSLHKWVMKVLRKY